MIPTGDLKAEARSNTLSSSLVSTETLKEVENIFLTAARLSPQQTIDPQIQVRVNKIKIGLENDLQPSPIWKD